jgi:hypothetical protein
MITQKVVINGKVYKLQHPGNREWLKLQASLYNPKTDTFNLETMLDYCFENVVFPETGNKLSLDDESLLSDLEVWQTVLPSFLRGKLETGYIWPDNKQSIKEGRKLLQTES